MINKIFFFEPKRTYLIEKFRFGSGTLFIKIKVSLPVLVLNILNFPVFLGSVPAFPVFN